MGLCIFAATIFWFFNALNKNYSATISFPLQFDYDQKRYMSVKELPGEVQINVSGMGWDLFRRSFGLKVPSLVIPLERPADVKKIVGSTLSPVFSSQLEGVQINFVLTDTLFIAIDYIAQRHLAVHIDSVIKNLRPGYMITSPVTIDPDTIQLEGPQSRLNEFDKVVSLPFIPKNIDENFNETIDIIIPNGELIKKNPEQLRVKFTVDKIARVRDSVLLEVINLPPRWKSKLDISTINIEIELPQQQSSIDSLALHAILDLKNLTRGRHKLTPTIHGLPTYARLVAIDTVTVTY